MTEQADLSTRTPALTISDSPNERKPVWVKDQGLTLLFEPANTDHINADIVFVHGLQGHPYKTWRFKDIVETKVYDEDAKPSKKLGMFNKKPQRWKTVVEKKRTYWPQDLLPNDVTNARIPTNRSNISQHGLTLLNAVSRERLRCLDRPLIFVAHSLGGILVKQALVQSWKAKEDGQERNLHKACKAVLFFGTPHRGSPAASLGLVMKNIAKVAQMDVNKSILTDLDPFSGSSTLSVLLEDFNGLLRREGLKVHSFQEGTVLLEKLDFAERSAREVQIENADADASTVDWIWNINDGRSSFGGWLQNDEPIFWIQGKPGSGKSTLMRHLSRQAKEVINSLSASVRGPWKLADFFFDFRAGSGVANNLEGLLRSLCVQIGRAVPSVDLDLRQISHSPGTSSDSWSFISLKKTLDELLQQLPDNLCIFVDGLDEFQGDMLELLKLLKSLPRKARGQKMLKMCLASRPEPVIASLLESQAGLKMHDYNYAGIERYLLNAVEDLEFPSIEEPWRLDSSSRIASKAEGIFLWARFALYELVESHVAGETSDELQLRLEALPPSMNELYANILKRMGARDRDDGRLLCQLICCPTTFELTIRQLKEAHAIASNHFQPSKTRDLGGSLERFRKRLRARTGGLVEEVPDKKKSTITNKSHDEFKPGQEHNLVKTIHRSVNSFLESEGWLVEPVVNGQKFRSLEAIWLSVCCSYLEYAMGQLYPVLPVHARGLEMTPLWPKSLSHFVQEELFGYARVMEYEHGESAFQYLNIVSDAIWCRFGYIRTLDFPDILYLNEAAIRGFRRSQPWQVMVEQGLTLTVKEALEMGKYNVFSERFDISLALGCYIGNYRWDSRGQKNLRRLISILIEHGARPRTEDIVQGIAFYGTPLLDLLLQSLPKGKFKLNRSSKYVPAGLSDTEMQNYTHNGEAVGPLWELGRNALYDFELKLDYFLNRGEDINEICGPGGTIFHALIIKSIHKGSSANILEILEATIARGAHVDIAGPRGTPLQMTWKFIRYSRLGTLGSGLDAAARMSVQKILIFLRDHEADSNWVEEDGLNVDERDIDALCSMNKKQLIVQYQPRLGRPDWYTWQVLTPEEQRKAESDKRVDLLYLEMEERVIRRGERSQCAERYR